MHPIPALPGFDPKAAWKLADRDWPGATMKRNGRGMRQDRSCSSFRSTYAPTWQHVHIHRLWFSIPFLPP